MATNIEQITALYVGYYGRAPEPEGLNYWVGRLNDGMTLTEIAQSYSVQPESIANYPYLANQNIASPATFITQIYLNLFNHVPDAEGLAYWTNELANGHDVGSFILDVISGAVTAPDSTVVANKIAVGVDFALSAANVAGFVYNDAAASAAHEVINGVDATDASVAAAKAETDAFIETGDADSTPPVALTTAVDTLVGTAGNDDFRGVVATTNATLTTADSIDGGAGTDTLAVTFDTAGGAVSLPAADINNVENFEVRNVSGQTATINFAAIAGEELVVNDRSANDVSFSGLAANTVAEVRNTTSATDVAYEATVTAASVVISGGAKADDVKIDGAALTSATITSENGANTVAGVEIASGVVKTVTVDATSNLVITGGISGAGIAADATVKATGAGSINLGQLATNVDVVDASANTGGVTVTLDAELDTKFTGGTGADVVTLGAAPLTTGSVDGGAGTDVLVANGTNLNNAAAGAKYTNFETLRATAGAIDMDNIAGITAIQLAGSTVAVTDLSAAQAAAIQVQSSGSFTIGVKDASVVNHLDTVALTIDDAATGTPSTIALTALNLAGVETLTVNAVDNVTIDTLANATALTGVTLSGAGTQTITTGGVVLAANTTINGSAATGKLTIDASAAQSGASTGLAITGGSAVDTISGSLQGDAINGGAGNDMLLGRSGADIIVGGEGNDTIQGDGVGTAAVLASTEVATVDFAALLSGETIILDGLTFTAGVGGASASAVAAAFAGGPVVGGTLSGALANYTAGVGDADSTVFTAIAPNTNAPNVTNTGNGAATVNIVPGSAGSAATIGLGGDTAGVDVLTGGAGNDAFRFAAGSSLPTASDTITDLNLGTNVVGGQVDTLVFENAAATVAVVTLTSGEQATVTAAADLGTAVAAVEAVAAVDGNTVQFTYGTDTYIFHNDGGADQLIKVTGITGTLDASDISVI